MQHYQDQHTAHLRERASRDDSWLMALRQDAMNQFLDTGFPSSRQENWKYTDMSHLDGGPYELGQPSGGTGEIDALLTQGPSIEPHLLFVDGLLHRRSLPEEVQSTKAVIDSLDAVYHGRREEIQGLLASSPDTGKQPFVSLNTAFLSDGAYIRIPRGTHLEKPIHLVFISGTTDAPTASHPRNLLVFEDGSSGTVVEHFIGPDESAYFTNTRTEIHAGAGANVTHYVVERQGNMGVHVGSVDVRQDRDSNVHSHTFWLGGELVRNDLNVRFLAEHGFCRMEGLYLLADKQHVDNHTRVDHDKPHCTSVELYKGILSDRSRGVFNGKVVVAKDAQKSDAQQTNHNIVLSRNARIDTKPELEIYADDVKCSHGSTVGQLDADALFFLRARGIPETQAKHMLTAAFTTDLVEAVKDEDLREYISELVRIRVEKLEQGTT
tara:strand:+ start:2655 stop:3965 length:1311 start_codon:yes stop_codon:yes gene_type:complete